MKIVYLIRTTHTGGGMNRILCNKANYLVDNGYDVTIITTCQKDRPKSFKFSNKIRFIDLNINYLDASGKPLYTKLLALPFRAIKHKKRLSKVLKEEQFDIVISMFDGEVRFLNSININSKKIAELHLPKSFRLLKKQSSMLSIFLNKIATKIDEKVVKTLDKLVILTDEDKVNWPDTSNITRIYNFVDIPDTVSTVTNKTAIAVGRFSAEKGFDMLVEAWAKIHKSHPDWQLDIYGGGDKTELQQQIDQLGLGGVITLNDPTPDIYSKILDSSIYLMTSRYEGLPMVLLEANACGVPAVSFACKSGPKDIITDGENGFLVPQDDIETFADRVCQMIENEDLRKEMGGAARKNIEEHFSEEVVMKQWEELFKELVTK